MSSPGTAAMVLGERLRRIQAIIYAVSLGGVIFLSSNAGTFVWNGATLYGLAMILVAVSCCAIYAVGCREYRTSDGSQAMFVVSA